MEELVMGAEEIIKAATDSSFAIWFLIGASLVFFMQAGFAMVETGFTRAKNAGNIAKPACIKNTRLASQWLRQDLQEQRMPATLL